MYKPRSALLNIAAAGAILGAILSLYRIFVGPGGVVASLLWPLAVLAAFSALYVYVSPAGRLKDMALAPSLGGRIPPPVSRALCAFFLLLAIGHLAASLAYVVFGKIAISAPLGIVRVDNLEKPLAFAVLGLCMAFFSLAVESRMGALQAAQKYRLHAVMALFTAALCFLAGEAVVRIASAKFLMVRYLVQVEEERKGVVFPSFEAYLASKPDIKPFMPLLNYYDNSLGMRDVEFTSPKPEGRYRIMALGDSFTYGMVPYPDSVMTVLEERLREKCGGKDLDVQNFGVTGGDLWDYKTIHELAAGKYQPDLVALHFYMGNDGPNIYYGTMQLPGEEKRKSPGGSYLLRFIRNILTVAKSVESEQLKSEWDKFLAEGSKEGKCGGCEVTPGQVITDDTPELKNPYFVHARWIFYISIIEVGVMYVPDEKEAEKMWTPAFQTLDSVAREAARHGRKLVIILYPSSFQIHPERVEEFLEGIADVENFRDD
ncbi:MAG: hypothetical protein OEZ04_13505, partial [Nitrospinota bacterium]|nr:hypothetical protein [Nitrospinota bacterium]